MTIAKVDYCKLTVFMENQNWQGGPVLTAKIGPGGPLLAADRFFRYSTIMLFKNR